MKAGVSRRWLAILLLLGVALAVWSEPERADCSQKPLHSPSQAQPAPGGTAASDGLIAYIHNSDLWIGDANGQEQRRLMRHKADADEFARLATDGRRFAWVEGEVILFAPPNWAAQPVTSTGYYQGIAAWRPGTDQVFVGNVLEDGPDGGLWLVDTHRHSARRVIKPLDVMSIHEQNIISPGKRYLASSGVITAALFVTGLNLKTLKPLRLPKWATHGLDGGSEVAWLDDDHLLVGRGTGIDPSTAKGGLWVLDIKTRNFHRWLYSNSTDVDTLLRQSGGDALLVGLPGINKDRDIAARFEPMVDRLELVNVNTRQRLKLPIPGPLRACQFSADGKQLLALMMRPHQEVADAYIVDIRTGARHLVAKDVTDAVWMQSER